MTKLSGVITRVVPAAAVLLTALRSARGERVAILPRDSATTSTGATPTAPGRPLAANEHDGQHAGGARRLLRPMTMLYSTLGGTGGGGAAGRERSASELLRQSLDSLSEDRAAARTLAMALGAEGDARRDFVLEWYARNFAEGGDGRAAGREALYEDALAALRQRAMEHPAVPRGGSGDGKVGADAVAEAISGMTRAGASPAVAGHRAVPAGCLTQTNAEGNTQTSAEGSAPMTADILRAQDDTTSAGIISFFEGDAAFEALVDRESKQIMQRDAEDGEKLQAGVDAAVARGVLPTGLRPPTYQSIQVLGKTADQVAEEIIDKLPKEGGCVVILCGLSGTGKGTTVSKLKSKLPGCATWSNGNCFRSLTLLASRHCELNGKDFDPECLTPKNLAEWIGMLEFGQFDGQWDIRVNGLGIDERVSEIANTLLKEGRVAKNIPTVAEQTQGEVVKFASDACQKMGSAGVVVLLEGREQTLNFISSDCRFRLEVSDPSVLGSRRAAQRIAAEALKTFQDGDDISDVLQGALATVAST